MKSYAFRAAKNKEQAMEMRFTAPESIERTDAEIARKNLSINGSLARGPRAEFAFQRAPEGFGSLCYIDRS
jgi:hypothetical protein